MTQATSPPSGTLPPQDPQGETHQISRAAGLIGAATFCSRILGFIRDIILANLFGANAAADAFYIAYRIPNLLRELFAEAPCPQHSSRSSLNIIPHGPSR